MKRILSVIASIALLCSVSLSSAAAADTTPFSDLNGHWGRAAMEQWSERGVLQGSDGLCRPDEPITRGEMAVVLQRVIGYQSAQTHSFSDLDESWYTSSVCALTAAGVMKGFDGLIRPADPISREEAAVLFARAFQLPECTAALPYSDADAVAPWAKTAVSALSEAGYIKGYEGTFAPAAPITRASVITILDHMVAAYYSVPGEYSGDVHGNVLVNTGDVVLKNGTIFGDLIIADGVGNGDVSLDHVTVTGNVILRGCGENSFHILPGTDLSGSTIIICKTADGGVRLVNESGTPIPMVNVADGLEGVTLTGSFENVVIASDVPVALKDANVTKAVSVTAENSNVAVTGKSTVAQMEIAKTASGTQLKVEGKGVTTLTVAGNGLTVDGKAEHMNVAPDVTQKPETPAGKPVTPAVRPDSSDSSPVITVLSAATANLASPQAGKPAVDAVPGGAGFTVTTSWEPALVDGKFAKATVYVATLRFTPTYGYQWPAAAPTVAVNNSTAYGGNAALGAPALEGSVVTVTATYEATVAALGITISGQPENLTLTAGSTSSARLTVAAHVAAGDTSPENYPVSYAWYQAETAGKENPVKLEAASGSVFHLPANLVAGTYHYFCRMTADGCETVDSSVATVTVAPGIVGGDVVLSNFKLMEDYGRLHFAWDTSVPCEKYDVKFYSGGVLQEKVGGSWGTRQPSISLTYAFNQLPSSSTIDRIEITPLNPDTRLPIGATASFSCNIAVTVCPFAEEVTVSYNPTTYKMTFSGIPADCAEYVYNVLSYEGGSESIGFGSNTNNPVEHVCTEDFSQDTDENKAAIVKAGTTATFSAVRYTWTSATQATLTVMRTAPLPIAQISSGS